MDDEELVNGAARARDGRFTEPEDRRWWDELTRTEAYERYKLALDQTYRSGSRRYTMTVPLALQAAAGFRLSAERLEYFAIAFARAHDWSWSNIGAALGISKSSAQRRYAARNLKRPKRRPLSS